MNDPIRIQAVDWQEQRPALMQIRWRVFVQEQGVPPELEEDAHDPSARHLLAHAAGLPVGCGRLLINGPRGRIGRMAVLPEYRHRGIGTQLLRALIELAQAASVRQLELHAQCQAEAFYRRAGFSPVGEIFDEAGIPHRRMQCQLTPRPGAI